MSQTPAIRISQHQYHHDAGRYPSNSTPPHRTLIQETPLRHLHPVPQSWSTSGLGVRDPPSAPMSILNSPYHAAPPPLPPPPHLPEPLDGQDLGWRWGNDASASDYHRPAPVKPGSSLLGAWKDRPQSKEDEVAGPANREGVGRESSISTVRLGRDGTSIGSRLSSHNDDESMPRPDSNRGLQSERELSQRTLDASSKSYDTQMLNRMCGPSKDSKRPSLSAGVHDSSAPSHSLFDFERRSSTLRPLQIPSDHWQTVTDSSSSWRPPASGAVSPGSWSENGPLDARTIVHTQVSFSDDGNSHKGSHDRAMFVSDDLDADEGRMSALQINDRSPGSPKAGSKRRASSPPREREDRSSVSSASGQSDVFSRRAALPPPGVTSPSSRYQHTHSSVSSLSSFGPPHGSLGSSLGLASVASSATSYASGPISPSGMSPAPELDLRLAAPSGGTRVIQNTPAAAPHQRTHSENMPMTGHRRLSGDTSNHARHSSFSHLQGGFVCECCPKKPKKFDTEAALRIHESEKQYTCMYCPNRFKNKNEAERHQNSLHLRSQSWSCANLSGPENAFNTLLTSAGNDVCGYCGVEFSNPPQWDVRADHLSNVHKYRDCNHMKKFYRADHFRQHLKHSHQGTSGKWTNILENACVQDEPPEMVTSASSRTVAVPQASALFVAHTTHSTSDTLPLRSAPRPP